MAEVIEDAYLQEYPFFNEYIPKGEKVEVIDIIDDLAVVRHGKFTSIVKNECLKTIERA